MHNDAHSQTPALAITNLRVDYAGLTAVDDLTLTIPPGEIFGLVGPNGAGKTSTIRVLATLQEPTYGEVRIAGFDLFEETERVHEVLGYMPDLAPVVPNLKVWEFLDLYAASHGFRGSEKRDRVDSCLDKVKLADKRNAYGRTLSRGMTQRVVLAKTLLHEPRVLLLDEPASGLDPIARRDMRQVLQEIAADGATIVVSSHILSELADFCTSVGFMHLGRLLKHGPLETVLASSPTESAVVRVDVIGSAERAAELLAARDGVSNVRCDATKLTFELAGDERVRAALLRDLVAHGVEIAAFTPERSRIETLLMSLVEEGQA